MTDTNCLKYLVVILPVLVILTLLNTTYLLFGETGATVSIRKRILIVSGGHNGFHNKFWDQNPLKNCDARADCVFSTDKRLRKNATGLWFEAKYTKTPPVVMPGQKTFLVDGEPYHHGMTGDDPRMQKLRAGYDYIVSYRHDSDIRWLYARDLISSGLLYLPPLDANKKLNKIVFMNSNCNTPSRREKLVKEIMDLGIIQVDSYGRCLRNYNGKWVYKSNRTLIPGNDRITHKIPVFSRYKFCIAMENAIVTDYHSEKLWEALASGCVPIYFGDTSVETVLPVSRHDMYIDVRDFEQNMTKLSLYLQSLLQDDTKYKSLLLWKNMTPSTEFDIWRQKNSDDPRCIMCKSLI